MIEYEKRSILEDFLPEHYCMIQVPFFNIKVIFTKQKLIDEMIQSNQQTFKYKTKMKCTESCYFLGTLLIELKIRLLYKKTSKLINTL